MENNSKIQFIWKEGNKLTQIVLHLIRVFKKLKHLNLHQVEEIKIQISSATFIFNLEPKVLKINGEKCHVRILDIFYILLEKKKKVFCL